MTVNPELGKGGFGYSPQHPSLLVSHIYLLLLLYAVSGFGLLEAP